MAKVAITKTEYEQLKRQAEAYRKFATGFFEMALRDPIEEVVEDFKRTNLYTEEFLDDLGSGLRKSSYTKKHGNRSLKKRSQGVSSSS